MHRITIKVHVNDLTTGMYVVSLDRPWLETPFLMQGFQIDDGSDIETLRQYCEYVNVEKISLPPGFKPTRRIISEIKTKRLNDALPQAKKGRYEDTTSIEVELKTARKVQMDLETRLKMMLEDILSGRQLNVSNVKRSADAMINSVIRNPDAMIWLAQLKSKDNYSYRHSIGASVWSVALGRQLGLPKNDLKSLTMGALLCDIGKVKIPADILQKPKKLTDQEFSEIKKHVTHSLDMLTDCNGVDRQVVDIVANHHERHNGSGYPNNKVGDEIPILAKIAGLADCYDAITSQRHHANACAPSQAIKKLYEWRDTDFQSELVEEFIQAIGIYPAGSLVELSNGKVGIVMSEGRKRRLRPKVLCILDSNKQRLQETVIINLQDTEQDEEGKPLHIKAALEPGAYSIDSDEFYI